jgi:hypothetical protein
MAKSSKPKKSGSDMATGVMQRKGRGRLTREVQQKIGSQLRAMYDDVVKQGVPDRFTELLAQLDERNNKGNE